MRNPVDVFRKYSKSQCNSSTTYTLTSQLVHVQSIAKKYISLIKILNSNALQKATIVIRVFLCSVGYSAC